MRVWCACCWMQQRKVAEEGEGSGAPQGPHMGMRLQKGIWKIPWGGGGMEDESRLHTLKGKEVESLGAAVTFFFYSSKVLVSLMAANDQKFNRRNFFFSGHGVIGMGGISPAEFLPVLLRF